MNALVTVPQKNAEIYRASTDAAGLCREIVVQTAKRIGDRQYVQVEGWQAIAIAHGCAASSGHVERIEGGVRAIGEVRRMADGAIIATAEGYVGEDEPVWFGGTARAWKWGEKRGEKVWYDKVYEKRADYAIRAMAQTRAISRACRSAFAHVVVMMNAGLSTTPAEEVPEGGFVDVEYTDTMPSGAPSETTKNAASAKPPRPVAAITAAKVAIDQCGDKPALDSWLKNFATPLANIKADCPDAYDEIMGHLAKREAEFRGEADPFSEAA